jgi:flagellar biosynthetic protein FliR
MMGMATSQLMQMPGVDLQLVLTMLLQYLLSSLRIGAFLLSAPLFGARWLPLQIRIIMAFAMGTAVAGFVPVMDLNTLTSSTGMVLIFIEIAIGLTAGLTLTIWFTAMLLAGEKIASSSGLGYAAQVDPTTGANTPVVSQILYLFLLVIFISVDGHLIAIATMMESYRILPVGSPVEPNVMIAAGIGAAGSMFLSAAIIMLPIAMVLLMINVTVGIISRSAPTLNLFSFGFPITLISVFILLYVSAGAFGASAQGLIDSGLFYVQTMIGDLANG